MYLSMLHVVLIGHVLLGVSYVSLYAACSTDRSCAARSVLCISLCCM